MIKLFLKNFLDPQFVLGIVIKTLIALKSR